MVNLFLGNRLNVAVLVDVASGNKANLMRLERIEGLKSNAVHRITDFIENDEGDIEDLLSPNLYATLVNEAFSVPARLLLLIWPTTISIE